jgi:hypothetical protein
MTSDEAKKLKKQWGKAPCGHPDIISEKYTAADNWYCVQCGHLLDYDEWQKARKVNAPASELPAKPSSHSSD